jgi:hypothetical protein
MDERLTNHLLRTLAGLLVLGGAVAVVLGYLGVRDQSDIVLQMGYVASGGIGGLALIGIGALVGMQYQIREQNRRMSDVVDRLDDWKDAALEEIRSFLASAEVEVELRDPRNNLRSWRDEPGTVAAGPVS